ncbi:PP2C family protein-serine/threonine phosphatase [Streptomyces sp. NPDC046939]|uniref:PP2C family protein-serine/threonine phosphatase n=1 Tax=Streptomyces sp. NPDC046939 TaxID=3155376 RepID=UPI0033F094A8
MPGDGPGLGELLAAVEDAAPCESVDVVARNLEDRFDACEVSFVFLDLVGQEVVRLPRAGSAGEPVGEAERLRLPGSRYEHVLRGQELLREDEGGGRVRLVAPVTNRGDCIGVLELVVPHADDTVREAVAQAAHALAYIVVTDQRFTDLYHWGRRTTHTSLAAEIQHQLLPTASSCEAAQFTLACALAPADSVGGDTYDYSLDQDTLHLSITDAMGHDTESALLATLTVNALRQARRAQTTLLEQAHAAHQALISYDRGLTTGQLLRIDLETGQCHLVNAGHPWPLLLRDGHVREVPLAINRPFGIPVPADYAVQPLRLATRDRLVLLTDGMQERDSAAVDLLALLKHTADEHPREAVRALIEAVREANRNELPDDATVMVLDWHGSDSGRRHSDAGSNT